MLEKLRRTIRERLYRPPSDTIAGNQNSTWPSAGQPIKPLYPQGGSLAMPVRFGQNLTFTQRPDAELSAVDLRRLSIYPLARILIENVKDQICNADLKIQLRQRPSESTEDIRERREVARRGSRIIYNLYKALEKPDGEMDWSEWLRHIIDDMLVLDAASIEVCRRYNGEIAHFSWIPGDDIIRYVDDRGRTPMAPSPAYAQNYEGIPRVNFSRDQLLYKPRNIVPRGTISSYLYGFSPVEQMGPEIEIGMARLIFVHEYYKTGSMPNFLHIVPSKVSAERIQEAMDFVNSGLAGQLDQRRMYRAIQGFTPDGKDQIMFPNEPTLADAFDDLHIRRMAYAFGSSPQRLMRMMNRASAQAAQTSAENEGLQPFMRWVCRSVGNSMVEMLTGSRDYEVDIRLFRESDELNQAKVGKLLVDGGRRTINEDREERGEDRIDEPAADQLAITTPTGRIPIATKPQLAAVPRAGKDVEDDPKGPARRQLA